MTRRFDVGRRRFLRDAVTVTGLSLTAGCLGGDPADGNDADGDDGDDGGDGSDGSGNGDGGDGTDDDGSDGTDGDGGPHGDEGGAGSSWTAYKYDAAKTSANAATEGPRSDPTVAWEVDLGMWGGNAEPVLADGVLYVDGPRLAITALEAATGDERWSTEVEGFRTGEGLELAGGLLLVATESNLVALEASGGDERWTALEDEETVGTPTVVDGIAYVQGEETVYALDAADGTERWRAPTAASTSTLDRTPSPAVVDGTVFVAGRDERVYALDAADGAVLWEADEADDDPPTPSVVGDAVLVGWGGGVRALDAATGDQAWETYTSFAPKDGFGVADGTVYVAPGSGGLLALDVATGDEEWVVETRGKIYSNPTITAETIYCGTDTGDFRAYDRATGDERWAFDLETTRDATSAPIVVDGVCYAVSGDGNVYALTD